MQDQSSKSNLWPGGSPWFGLVHARGWQTPQTPQREMFLMLTGFKLQMYLQGEQRGLAL